MEFSMHRRKAMDYLENAYLLVLALFLIGQFLANSMIVLQRPYWVDWSLRVLAVVLILARLMLQEKKSVWFLPAAVFLLGIFSLSYMKNNYAFLLDLPIFVLGAFRISYKKILKVNIVCSISVLGIAFFGTLCGAVRDLIYIRAIDSNYVTDFIRIFLETFFDPKSLEELSVRHSFGTVYCTDMASWVFFLSLLLFVYFKRIPGILFSAMFVFEGYLLYIFCGARNTALLFIVAAFYACYTWIAEKCAANGWPDRILRGITGTVGVIAVPLGFWTCIKIVMMDPGEKLWQLLDKLLSGRLNLALAAIEEFGIKPFGTPFDQVGNGVNESIPTVAYNFVDSSFCLIPIRYGIWVALGTCILFGILAFRGSRKEGFRIAGVVCLSAVHGVVEHHLIELAYSGILLLTFAEFTREKEKKIEKKIEKKLFLWGKDLLALLSVGILVALAFREIPAWRVFYTDTQRSSHFLLIMCCLLTIVFLFLEQLSRYRRPVLCVGLYLCAIEILLLPGIIARQVEDPYMEELLAATPAMESMKNLADYGLITMVNNDYPKEAVRKLPGFSEAFWYGNGNADEKNMVLFAGIDQDLYMLNDAGFQFVPYSEHYGLYTNSKAVLAILSANGYTPSSVYNCPSKMKLKYKNGEFRGGYIFKQGRRGRILRSDLHMKAEILENREAEDFPIGCVRIFFHMTGKVVYEKEVFYSELNEEGELQKTIDIWIQNAEGYELVITPYGGVQMEVTAEYWKEH